MSQAQQSPIDLTAPIVTDFGREGLEIKWKKSAHGKIYKDEHGVHVEFGGDERQFIVLGRKKFHLVQFHFHHPSEHWIDGRQQTMELHVVHQNLNDGSRAVIGIFIEASSDAESVPALVPHIKSLFGGQDQLPEIVVSTNPLDWLPSDTSLYYRYEGSLTTPDYDENVSWVVLKDPLLMPKDDLVELIEIFRHPARIPQALNRRFLLSNFKP
jgi:carbonic anhydrase